MIQVRNGVFETNSSSTHSICIPKKTNRIDTYVEFGIGEYGWENRRVDDTPSYLYTAILCAYDYDVAMEKIETLKSILNSHSIGYSFEKPKWRFYSDDGSRYLDNGYIDHSYDTHEFVEAVLNDEDMLLRYLFDGTVFTGNDNQDCIPDGCGICRSHYWVYDNDWNGKEVANPYHDPENFDYFYKGN